MQWTNLTTIDIEEWFSPKLKKTAESLNERIGYLLGNRQSCNEWLAKVSEEDAAEFDVVNTVEIPFHKGALLNSLQEELRLRRELAEFDDQRQKELAAQVDVAFQGYEQAQKDVRKMLLDIGYHDFQNHTPDPCRFLPGWIFAHPRVVAAKAEHVSLQCRAGSRDFANANTRAIDEVTKMLDRARQDALPV